VTLASAFSCLIGISFGGKLLLPLLRSFRSGLSTMGDGAGESAAPSKSVAADLSRAAPSREATPRRGSSAALPSL
jgi:hypothetical protein